MFSLSMVIAMASSTNSPACRSGRFPFRIFPAIRILLPVMPGIPVSLSTTRRRQSSLWRTVPPNPRPVTIRIQPFGQPLKRSSAAHKKMNQLTYFYPWPPVLEIAFQHKPYISGRSSFVDHRGTVPGGSHRIFVTLKTDRIN